MQEPTRLKRGNRLFAQVEPVNQLRLLLRLYSKAKGKKCLIELKTLIPLDQDESEVSRAASHLKKRGLIIKASNRRGPRTRSSLRLTDRGVVEVKRLMQPAPKEIKCVTNIYYNQCVIHESVNDSSITTQNFGAKSAEVLLLIKELRQSFQSLPAQDRAKALNVVDALEKEVKKEHPRRDKVKSFLGQLGLAAGKPLAELLVSEGTKQILREFGLR